MNAPQHPQGGQYGQPMQQQHPGMGELQRRSSREEDLTRVRLELFRRVSEPIVPAAAAAAAACARAVREQHAETAFWIGRTSPYEPAIAAKPSAIQVAAFACVSGKPAAAATAAARPARAHLPAVISAVCAYRSWPAWPTPGFRAAEPASIATAFVYGAGGSDEPDEHGARSSTWLCELVQSASIDSWLIRM